MRFPEFEGEWKEHNISDFLSESKIIGHNGKEAKKLTVKLWAKGVVEKTTIFDGSMQTQYYIRKSGQLVYGKLDFLNCAFGIIPPELDGYETTSDAPAFDILNINSQFLLNRIIQTSFYKKNGEKANGSRKAKRIHPDTFLSMNVYVPSLLEQEKIATFVLLLNKKLEIQENILKMLKLYKRGLLSKLFPQKDESVPQYRLEGFTNDWEQRKLIEEVSSIDTGKSKFTVSELGNYEILGSTSVIGYDDSYDYEGDFILTARVGANAGELYRHSGKVKISDNTVFIQGKQLDFIFYTLQNFNIKKLSFGTGQPLVKASELKDQKISMPASENERTQIGTYFSTLDHLISLHQQMCNEIQRIKKIMLRNMFI